MGRLAVWTGLTDEERCGLIHKVAAERHITQPEALRRLSRGSYEAVRKKDGTLTYYDNMLLADMFPRPK